MFNPNKKIISITIASLLSITVTTTQAGNTSSSSSTGNNNAIEVTQSGSDLVSNITQAVGDNSATVNQTGINMHQAMIN